MKNRCQHIIDTECNKLLKIIQKFEELFDGTIGTCKTDPVRFELKLNIKPICSRPYTVPKLQK